MRRQIFRFCTAAFFIYMYSDSDVMKAYYLNWFFFGGGLLICFVIKLDNIQVMKYDETTVEWEQWAVVDSDWITLIWVWLVTGECFCDRWKSADVIFQSKLKYWILNEIQWAFLKFSKIHELKRIKFIKSGFSIYDRCRNIIIIISLFASKYTL